MSVSCSGKEVAIMFVGREEAELVPIPSTPSSLGPEEIQARTLVSLVSRGTEIVGSYRGTHYQMTDASYPTRSGYASVSQVEAVGSGVTDFAEGDLVLGGGHSSVQRGKQYSFVKIPKELSPEAAVFARMAKISMPAYVRTDIRPPELLVVTGLGVVGLLAAQLGQHLGYQVLACDPDERRREMAREHGVLQTLPAVPHDNSEISKKVGFGLDCSGYEQAVLDLCNVVRIWGEVAMVGVPWVPTSSILAQKILHSVFYNYVNLKSGWEGQMPSVPHVHSSNGQHTTALQWLAEGSLRIEPCAYRVVSPANPQQHYQDLLHGRGEELTVMFDWRQL